MARGAGPAGAPGIRGRIRAPPAGRPGDRAGRPPACRAVRRDQAGWHPAGGRSPSRPGWTPWCCGCSTRSGRAPQRAACRAGSPRSCTGRCETAAMSTSARWTPCVTSSTYGTSPTRSRRGQRPALPHRVLNIGTGRAVPVQAHGRGAARDQRLEGALRRIRLDRRARRMYRGRRPTSHAQSRTWAGSHAAISQPLSPPCGRQAIDPALPLHDAAPAGPQMIVPAYFHPATPPA